MSSKAKRMERSVDSLQKLYAVVVALAIGQAIKGAFLDRESEALLDWNVLQTRLPAFLAFVATIVPFFHGMNGHLDRCYVSKANEDKRGALLFDFFTFFLMSSLLLLISSTLFRPIVAFLFLGILLLVDVIWGLIAHWIHYPGDGPSPKKWAAVNVICFAIGAVLALAEIYRDVTKAWALLVVAVGRTVLDYTLGWELYFPNGTKAAEAKTAPQAPAPL